MVKRVDFDDETAYIVGDTDKLTELPPGGLERSLKVFRQITNEPLHYIDETVSTLLRRPVHSVLILHGADGRPCGTTMTGGSLREAVAAVEAVLPGLRAAAEKEKN